MYGKGLKPLSIATVAMISVSLSLVFFYAPLDADQGFIQKIFYLHVPLAMTALVGFIVGGVFAIVYLLVGRRAQGTPWRRSLGLGGALVTGLYLLPFIRYPANPPGVGDPSTIDHRTLGYTLAIAIGAVAVWGAWRLSQHLRARERRNVRPGSGLSG